MTRALHLAARARDLGEVPVGALIANGGEILGEGCNQPISKMDPTSHAEVEAIRQASGCTGNYRLPPHSALYVTLEPCVMCAGAIVIARVERLVFAARDLRFGAVRSKFSLVDSELLNHRTIVEEGLCASEATELLASFFAVRRSS